MTDNNTSFDSLKKLSQTEKTFYLSASTSKEIETGEVKKEQIANAEVLKITVRGLTGSEVTAMDEILEAATAPKIYEEEQAAQMGTRSVFTGSYDFEDPKYLRDLEKLKTRQTAFICLTACKNFSDTPGDDTKAKTDTILKEISFNHLAAIASQIYAISATTASSKDDFFLKEDSDKENSENSHPTTTPPQSQTQTT